MEAAELRSLLRSRLSKMEAAELRSLLRSITSRKHFHQVHSQLITTSLISDPFLSGNLLQSFLRLNPSSLSYAQSLLLSSQNPTTFMYNSLFHAHVSNSQPKLTLPLFRHMRISSNTSPNNHTFPLLLKGYSQIHNISSHVEGRHLHSLILTLGFGKDPFVRSSLVHFYASCALIDDARRALDEAGSWSVTSCTALLSGYCLVGDLDNGRKLFDEMPVRNAVSWAAMVSGYVRNGRFDEALVLFREMLVGRKVRLSASVFVSVLMAIAELGALEEGRWIHAYLMRVEWKDWTPKLVSSLINMYSKCGDLICARQTFNRLVTREVDIWNAMITGLGLHGRGNEALRLFDRMVGEGIEPDDLTFIGLLSGCSHSGLVERGMTLFDSMRDLHGFEPKVEHYSCMVDLLGRAGLLREAVDLVRSMPMKPNGRIWGSLFGACRIHGDVELGESIGKHLIELEPDRSGRYLLLANLYASRDRYEDAVAVRETMKKRGVELKPGCSLIEIRGVAHEFLVGDRSHPKTREIYDMLDEIRSKLRLRGYVVDTKHSLFDISEEEKEGLLFWHSEKLAIAFGLISTRPGEVIRVVKNLRICGDCHSMVKVVSDAYDREIIVRDRSRFHHFIQGSCSCLDYW